MIKTISEIKGGDVSTFNRTFEVTTEKGYGLTTVIGFIKYQLGTAKMSLTPQKDFWTSTKAFFSIYDMQGVQIGTVVCYTNKNQFDVSYNVSSLFASGFSINKIA